MNKPKKGRPATGKPRITLCIDRDIFDAADAMRLKKQSAEGKEYTKQQWLTRLIEKGMKYYDIED